METIDIAVFFYVCKNLSSFGGSLSKKSCFASVFDRIKHTAWFRNFVRTANQQAYISVVFDEERWQWQTWNWRKWNFIFYNTG